MGILEPAVGRHRRAAATALGAGLAAAFGATPAAAQAPAAVGDAHSRERLAFEAAYRDSDGLTDEAELTRDAAVGFRTLDVDRDRKLMREELGAHDPTLFDRVDTNRDGVLTFPEVMRHKMKGFQAADTNKDGALGFEEMIAGATKELEGSRRARSDPADAPDRSGSWWRVPWRPGSPPASRPRAAPPRPGWGRPRGPRPAPAWVGCSSATARPAC